MIRCNITYQQSNYDSKNISIKREQGDHHFMPTPTNVLLLLTAAFLLSAVPKGTDMLYIIARSTGQGRPAGLISCLGIATAGLLQTGVVALANFWSLSHGASGLRGNAILLVQYL